MTRHLPQHATCLFFKKKRRMTCCLSYNKEKKQLPYAYGLASGHSNKFFLQKDQPSWTTQGHIYGLSFLLTFWGCFFGHLGFFIILFLILLFNIGFLLIFIL
jgi:hypothetical protein